MKKRGGGGAEGVGRQLVARECVWMGEIRGVWGWGGNAGRLGGKGATNSGKGQCHEVEA